MGKREGTGWLGRLKKLVVRRALTIGEKVGRKQVGEKRTQKKELWSTIERARWKRGGAGFL